MFKCAECGRPVPSNIWENDDANNPQICYDCFKEFYPHYAANSPKPKPDNIIAWEPGHNWGTQSQTVRQAWHTAHSSVRHTLRSGFYHRATEPRAQVSWHVYNIAFVATVYANGETILDYGEHC